MYQQLQNILKLRRPYPTYQSSFLASYASPDSLVEMIVEEENRRTYFLKHRLKSQTYEQLKNINITGKDYFPFPYENDLIQKKVVLFPSGLEKYRNESELRTRISDFIHKYLQVSEAFEKLAVNYVLMTWIYDKFHELPYLRALGDYGSGKTRLLQTVGALCYKSMWTSGAVTPAPIFRIIQQFGGTLLLDEADFRFSDSTQDIIKILNNGYSRGFPVLRCSSDSEHEVKAYTVFGPKIVATRFPFSDPALESRCITERMTKINLRLNIPLNLKNPFWKEAQEIRNQLLFWRFQNYGKRELKEVKGNLEPRRKQILAPLFSCSED